MTGDPIQKTVLNAEQRMLIQMRDALYEGNWDDFTGDLRARANHEPHVFDTIASTPGLEETIRRHLELIAEMRRWEEENHEILRSG